MEIRKGFYVNKAEFMEFKNNLKEYKISFLVTPFFNSVVKKSVKDNKLFLGRKVKGKEAAVKEKLFTFTLKSLEDMEELEKFQELLKKRDLTYQFYFNGLVEVINEDLNLIMEVLE